MAQSAATPFRRVTSVLAATAILVGCSTQMGRIGADDGRDVCRAQLVQLDSTGNFYGENIMQGAAVGALGGAVIGGLATGRWQGALVGAAIGGAGGAAVGYYAAVRRQARDQAGVNAQIAGDLQRENASLDRTQIAFDQLMDCRLTAAQTIRNQLAQGRLDRAVAISQMSDIRQRVTTDLQLANRISGSITERAGQFDTAIDQVVPGGRSAVPVAGTPISAPVRRAVRVTFSPQPNSPAIASMQQREVVSVRPGPPGFSQVETASGVRGYVPADAVAPPRSAAPAPVDGDVRSLAATNLSRRENFTASVGSAERLAQAGGFEIAS
jgi:outer membrane lipoprotein SlyB